MSTNIKISQIKNQFENLLLNKSLDEEAELEAKMIMAQFLSEIQPILDRRKIKRKDLAEMIGTSASFITQLYRGNKTISLTTLAKIKLALQLSVEIKITSHLDTLDLFDEHIGNYLKSLIKQNDDKYNCLYRVSEKKYDAKYSNSHNQLVA